MKKLILLIIKTNLISLVPITDAWGSGYITPSTVNSRSCLHLRSTRSSRSVSRGCFSNGTKMLILARRGNWIQVKTGRYSGWVYRKYTRGFNSASLSTNVTIDTARDNPSVNKYAVPKKMYINASSLHVRKGPGKENESIGFLKENSEIKAIGKSDDGKWVAIERNGKIYWIHGNFVQNSPIAGQNDEPIIDQTPGISSAFGNILGLKGIKLTTPICGCSTAKCRRTGKMGMRVHPITKKRKFHGGTDIGGGFGKIIVASANGIVQSSGRSGGYGNAITIDHSKGIKTKYAHMQKLFVRKGQKVKSGQKIGLMGSSGFSTGPHLHFEVRVNGKAVNAEKYVSVSRAMLSKSCNRKSTFNQPIQLSSTEQQNGGTQ